MIRFYIYDFTIYKNALYKRKARKNKSIKILAKDFLRDYTYADAQFNFNFLYFTKS